MTLLPTQIIHYSSGPIEKLESDMNYSIHVSSRILGKPPGLWVSIEDYKEDQNWKTWCEQNEFMLDGLNYAYLLKMKPDAKILFLDTCEKILEFGDKHHENLFPQLEDTQKVPIIKEEKLAFEYQKFTYALNWEDVTEEYDGIFIAPYQWNLRLDSRCSWYYGWDCSSGCIWDIKSIEEFKLLYKQDPPYPYKQTPSIQELVEATSGITKSFMGEK